jgi:hypothetical protein
MLDKINDTLDNTDKTFSLTAALASPFMMSVRSLCASAGLYPIAERMTVHDIDAKLAKSRLSTEQKIQVKIALDRSGLIAA